MLTLMQTGKLHLRNFILIYGCRLGPRARLETHAALRNHQQDADGLSQFADTVDQAFDRVRDDLERHHLEPDSLLQ